MIRPFPKPLPQIPLNHKVKRLPKGKAVTLVAGFRCADGSILMCADREESGDGTKRSIDKLKEWTSKNSHLVFATSGTTAVVANLYLRLAEQLDKNADVLETNHVAVISDVLRSIHKDFKEFKEWEELVIAASFYRDVSIPVSSFLYGTVGNVLEPVSDYVCKGGGKDLARYFCHRLYEQWPWRRQAVILAAFIFREVQDHVQGVGRGTDMTYLVTQRRSVWHVPHNYIAELEGRIPTLKEIISERWNNRIEIPKWLEQSLYSGENPL